MGDIQDGYQAYYAGKLWTLLPAIYRYSDATTAFDPTSLTAPNGPLRELVNRIGAQAVTLRRSIDRMWEDQSIDGCDDWVIPYIGAQLATNLVASLDGRAQRLEVANTIYYRQRKGTLPILEEIAADITGWYAQVVEMYRRMARTHHGLDPIFADAAVAVASGLNGANSGTPAGGYADLRNPYGATRTGTAFDEFAYTADLRTALGQTGFGQTGWYNIPNIGVFLWRLLSVPVQGVTPVAVTGANNACTFDPTGRDVPLFAAPVPAGDRNWLPRQEYQLPGPIDAVLLRSALPELYATSDTAHQSLQANALGLYSGVPSAATLIPLDQVTAQPNLPDRYFIDPVRGRCNAAAGSALPAQVGYCYGFPSTIGAGGYDRRVPGAAVTQVQPVLPDVTGGGGNMVAASNGTVQIADSLTYNQAPAIVVGGTDTLAIRAANLQRPLLRFTSSSPVSQWTLTGSDAGSVLILDGLFVSGGDVVLAGTFDTVTLSTCTFDPGSWDGAGPALAADGQALVPTSLRIAGAVGKLVIDRCIIGPIITADGGGVGQTKITASILQAVAPAGAIEIGTGMTTMEGCTVLGPSHFRQLEASNSIFAGTVQVQDNQNGCVRYSAWPTGSILPKQYESVELQDQTLFVSTAFGNPNYARLQAQVDPAIGAGAEDGSEMGVYARDKNPIKQRSLLIKYQEFMPVGITPVIIYVT